MVCLYLLLLLLPCVFLCITAKRDTVTQTPQELFYLGLH